MKALKITLSHGRIWTAETSSGVRTQSSTLEGALGQLVSADKKHLANPAHDFIGVQAVMDSIPNSGGDGNIARGQASG